MEEAPERAITLKDYLINYDTNLDYDEKFLRDAKMLEILNIYKTEQIIEMKNKPSITNLFQHDAPWEDAINDKDFIDYNYPSKLPSLIYSNKVIHKQDYCIIFVLTEFVSVKKAIESLSAMVNNAPRMKIYPVYFLTGFYLSDDNLLELFENFDSMDIDITVVKMTDIIVDGEMCERSINNLFDEYSDIKQDQYSENRDTRMYNDIENLYPSGLYKDTRKFKWKKIRQNVKESTFRIVYEEYGMASIDFIKLFSYDLYQFDCFKNYKKFMIMRPGIIMNAHPDTDLFESYYKDSDYAARFLNFRYSQRYRNAHLQEYLRTIFENLNMTIDSVFSKESESIWKQMFGYAIKNNRLYRKAKSRNFNVEASMKRKGMNLFNGILLDTQDSIFISKFEYFRSKEYELFYKNFLLRASIYNDAMIPNDPITLFLGLLKRNADDGNSFYRKDFEIINDVEVQYDVSGDGSVDEIIHNNADNVEHYMNIDTDDLDFTLNGLVTEDTLLPMEKREVIDSQLNNSSIVDQRFFSKYSYQNTVKIYKNHEFIKMMISQIFQKHQGKLTKEHITKALDLYINDNIKKMYEMFGKQE